MLTRVDTTHTLGMFFTADSIKRSPSSSAHISFSNLSNWSALCCNRIISHLTRGYSEKFTTGTHQINYFHPSFHIFLKLSPWNYLFTFLPCCAWKRGRGELTKTKESKNTNKTSMWINNVSSIDVNHFSPNTESLL